jgi:hypothetical protein
MAIESQLLLPPRFPAGSVCKSFENNAAHLLRTSVQVKKSVMLAAQGLIELACFEPIWYFEIMIILNFMKFINEFFL